MAIFSNKIKSVKFFDTQQTIIEILYNQGDKVISYALEVDWENQDLHDLLEEYDLEDIERSTIKKHNQEVIAKREALQPEKEIIVKGDNPFNFDFYTFLDKRYDPGFVFHVKADIFRLRGVMDLPKSKIKKIKECNDALELFYLLRLAIK